MEPTPLGDAPQRPTQATRSRLAFDHPVPAPGPSPVVGKPQQRERARWGRRTRALAVRRRRRFPERYESGLVRMERQAVLTEALRQNRPHPTGVPFLGEPDDEVVRVTNEESPATQAGLDLPFEPVVQQIVQEDV